MSSWSEKQKEAYTIKEKVRTPIAELKLPVRIVNTLEENNVLLVEDLLSQNYESLMEMKNFGDKTFREVKVALYKLGVPIPAEWDNPAPVCKEKPKKQKPQRRTDSLHDRLKLW